MNAVRAITVLMLATPVASSFADVSYSRARIAEPFPVVQSELAACLDRRDSLADRKVFLDLEKKTIDREGDAIAAEGARLAANLASLDNRDTAAVAAYNARSDDQNRRVAAHNRRVADMNSAASLFNGDSADMAAYCNWRASRPYFASTLR
jgi:hypothetical protein